MKSIFISFLFMSGYAFTQTLPPTILWDKCLGGSSEESLFPVVKQTFDSGYILCGATGSSDGDLTQPNRGWDDFWLCKFDSAGTIQWQKSYGGSFGETFCDVIQTRDSNYVVAVTTGSNDGDILSSHGYDEAWVAKLDQAGNIIWRKTLGGTNHDNVRCIQQTIDDGYVLAGSSQSNNGDATGNHGWEDFWIVKLDSAGTVQWTKSYGGSETDGADFIMQRSNGDYYVIGQARSNDGDVTGNHGGVDVWVLRLSSNGNILWQKSFGGSSSDYPSSFDFSHDNSLVIAANSQSNDGDLTGNYGSLDLWIFKIDTAGNLIWQKNYGGSSQEEALSIKQTLDFGFVIAAITMSNDSDVTGNRGGMDAWLYKIDSDGTLQWQLCYGGTSGDKGTSACQNADGSYMVAGTTQSTDVDISGNHGGQDFWITLFSAEVTTGVAELNSSNEEELKIYPNPAGGQLHFYHDEIKTAEQLIIYNSEGRIVCETNQPAANWIDVSGLDTGIYILEIKMENGNVKRRWVKM